ncbi:MAG TPA: SDR family oxidoreductase [Acidimicrobiia bacterium]|jgi:NAD(P)-dependent dehydrogenase (short-subunit alcohol dehydrogenase family)|nr:SDR family oxidoreductase [Acidimicrobiia bacterium]HIL46875.1 SDR family oxidoreductase [Acidimicrobiia bacterium]
MAKILITGSNSGFGFLSALTLARRGHQVVASMRNVARGGELQRIAEEEGLAVEVVELDVNDLASVERCLADPGSIDVLINNAGFEVEAAIEQLDDALMQQQFETNVMGPLRTMRAVLPIWKERRSGVVINVSSIAGRVGSPYTGAYSASKFALEALSESLNFEVSQLGIRVHLIEPGRFATDFKNNKVRPDCWEGSAQQQRSLAFRAASSSLGGSGEPPDPQLVADAIAQAAIDPSMPFRTLVGDDAKMIDELKSSMSFEEFEATIRTALNWHD